jgi:hypothetical protein
LEGSPTTLWTVQNGTIKQRPILSDRQGQVLGPAHDRRLKGNRDDDDNGRDDDNRSARGSGSR